MQRVFPGFITGVVCTVAAAAPPEEGAWEPRLDINQPPWSNASAGVGGVAHHAILLHTGEVLCIDTEHSSRPAEFLFNPANNEARADFVPRSAISPQIGLMCSGHAPLPDGRIVFVGGADSDGGGTEKVLLFNPAQSSAEQNPWSALADLHYGATPGPRWYPTVTSLPEGDVLVTGGTPSPNGASAPCYNCPGADCRGATLRDPALLPVIIRPDHPAVTQQVWLDQQDGQGAYTAGRDLVWYPFTFPLSTGRIFSGGTHERHRCGGFPPRETLVLNPGLQTWSMAATAPIEGYSAAMYSGNFVIKGDQHQAFIADVKEDPPDWSNVSADFIGREHVQFTIMADGNVIAMGGEVDDEPVMTPQIFRPDAPPTQRWKTVAPHQRPRAYHSATLLLPDGRVMVAGGTDPGRQPSIEIYRPPYLFDDDGTYPSTRRVTIDAAPTQMEYDKTYEVTLTTPHTSEVRAVHLLRLGAATHGLDHNQRLVKLDFTRTNSTALKIQAPANAQLAQFGFYMLFILTDGDRPHVLVPSVSRMVRMVKVID